MPRVVRVKKTTLSIEICMLWVPEYNVLYNGEIALEQGIESVNNASTENFWELLPIERMKVKDDVLPGQYKNQILNVLKKKQLKPFKCMV